MSAKRLIGSSFEPVTVEARQAKLELSADTVVIHKNGIEFRSPTPFKEWTEMTVSLQLPREGKLQCAGIIVACSGNKHAGYNVSMMFTSLSKQAETQLHTMARSDLGAG
jgi:hypothetical protein